MTDDIFLVRAEKRSFITKRAIKILLIYTSLCSLLACQSLKNRVPQSAGFGGYCPTCLVKNIDKDLAQLQNALHEAGLEASKQPPKVRYATVFNKDGQAICQVDLLKHPDAVPNFAKLNKPEFVQNTKSNNRQPAFAKTPPPCSKEYLAEIKKVAKNNVVLNGNKNFKKKISLKKELTQAGAWCIVGGGMGIGAAKNSEEAKQANKESEEEFLDIKMGTFSAGVAAMLGGWASAVHHFDKYEQLPEAKKHAAAVKKLNKKMLNRISVSAAGLCGLLGLVGSTVVFRNF